MPNMRSFATDRTSLRLTKKRLQITSGCRGSEGTCVGVGGGGGVYIVGMEVSVHSHVRVFLA